LANPLATILSLAMMLRFTFDRSDLAERVEGAVGDVLDKGLRTADIMSADMTEVGTQPMGDAVVEALYQA
jgi:3-isopropylmalate dehydrogenase